MSKLREITEAEAHPWPRTCLVCGLPLSAADWHIHYAGHAIESLRSLGQSAHDAVHALNGLSDAMVRIGPLDEDED